MTPHEVFDRAIALLLDHDMVGFAGLWAVDGTMEFPFAAPGGVRRLDGRAAVANYLRDYTSLVDVRSVPESVVHTTGDPEVIIAEFAAEGVAVATGQPYRMPYVAVIRVRDGEIVSYRDYWNLAVAGDAFTGFAA
ncbi:nuclear transport factor 2 family protein [Pseudonocardia nematodicida]|uniref:Nuclear transport factor 2 family protein n=1 Tax=Pseudonocardia nematodicida TaxID=1206997 RepID=A0ABV1KHJ8_9PSEU